MWSVYIIRCGDGTLFSGSSSDVVARLKRHADGHGARYTRGRGPLTLVYVKMCGTRSQACREELRMKRLSRVQKLALISSIPLEDGYSR